MIFYHGTTKESWAEIQREGVLWGRRWITDNDGTKIKEVDRCTYLAKDLEEAKCYGDTILQVEYDPYASKQNNYIDGCWQMRVYEPIPLSQIKLLNARKEETYKTKQSMSEENEVTVIPVDGDYGETVFSTRLYELFGKHDEGVAKYIKPGRKFWYFDGEKSKWRKLTVAYVRSNVMFYTFDDEPDVERAWFNNSIAVLSLSVAEIHPYEIADILSEWYPEAKEDFPDICRRCKWFDYDGSITVDVVWDA